MTAQDIDRIQSAIDHIKTSLDVDPWAAEIAVEAMQEKIKHFRDGTKKMDDLIRRKDAIDAVEHITSSMSVCVNSDECHGMKRMQRQAVIELTNVPSAQPQQKTGKWLDNPITAHSLAKHCSRCGYVCLGYDSITGARFQYCPSCGALMGGKNDEDD